MDPKAQWNNDDNEEQQQQHPQQQQSPQAVQQPVEQQQQVQQHTIDNINKNSSILYGLLAGTSDYRQSEVTTFGQQQPSVPQYNCFEGNYEELIRILNDNHSENNDLNNGVQPGEAVGLRDQFQQPHRTSWPVETIVRPQYTCEPPQQMPSTVILMAQTAEEVQQQPCQFQQRYRTSWPEETMVRPQNTLPQNTPVEVNNWEPPQQMPSATVQMDKTAEEQQQFRYCQQPEQYYKILQGLLAGNSEYRQDNQATSGQEQQSSDQEIVNYEEDLEELLGYINEVYPEDDSTVVQTGEAPDQVQQPPRPNETIVRPQNDPTDFNTWETPQQMPPVAAAIQLENAAEEMQQHNLQLPSYEASVRIVPAYPPPSYQQAIETRQVIGYGPNWSFNMNRPFPDGHQMPNNEDNQSRLPVVGGYLEEPRMGADRERMQEDTIQQQDLKCMECGYSCKSLNALKYHKNKQVCLKAGYQGPGGNADFKCFNCGREFKRPNDFTRHTNNRLCS